MIIKHVVILLIMISCFNVKGAFADDVKSDGNMKKDQAVIQDVKGEDSSQTNKDQQKKEQTLDLEQKTSDLSSESSLIPLENKEKHTWWTRPY